MDPLYVNYDKRKNATSNSAVPTPTASTMPVFGAPATPAAPSVPAPAVSAPDPTIPLAPASTPAAPAPAAPAPAPAAPIAPAPSVSPADTLVAELDAPAAVDQNPFASFQNNTPAAESQPMQQFAPSEQPLPAQSLQTQPLPTQPIGPAPISSGTGDIVLDMSQPKGGINKKLLAIISGVVLVAVIAVVAVIFLIPKDRATREDAEELYSLLSWVSDPSSAQCSAAIYRLENTYYTSESYQESTNACREDASKIKQLIARLDKVQDNGFKQVYGELKTAINDNMVFGEELDSELKLLEIWHQWVLNLNQEMSQYQTKKDIEGIVAPLIDSNNDTFKEFGKEWGEKRYEIIRTSLDLEVIPGSDSKGAYDAAIADMEELLEEEAPDIREMVKIGTAPKDSGFSVKLASYESYVEENYEKVF